MDKEVFSKKYNELWDKIRELQAEQLKLAEDYLAENQPYPIGTKVKITYPDGFLFQGKEKEVLGFVKEYELCYIDHEVYPIFGKIKKDGTMASYATWQIEWWRKPIIEVVKD